MDRGYHRHTEIMDGDEQRLDVPRTRELYETDVSDSVDSIQEKTARPAPISKHHFNESLLYGKEDPFRSRSTTQGLNYLPSNVCAHRFDNRSRRSTRVSWLRMYHLCRFIFSFQNFWQYSFRRSEGAVDESLFGWKGGTVKTLGDDSSHGQKFAQAFRVVRGKLRPIFDAFQARVKRISRKKKTIAKKIKNGSNRAALPLDEESLSSFYIYSPVSNVFFSSIFCTKFVHFIDLFGFFWTVFFAGQKLCQRFVFF